MKQKYLFALLALLLTLACTQEKTKLTPPPSSPESLPTQTSIPKTSSHEKFQKLIDQWLKAQNERDFLTYESLYADRFTGIRRSGNRTVPLNREGWMKDRKRMFAHPMKVEAEDLQISDMGETVLIQFKQTWTSATYQDFGLKNIVLLQIPDGEFKGDYRIVREELMSSEKEDLGDGLSFLYVIPQGLVIDTTPSWEWATGPAQFVAYDDVRKNVDFEKLPKHVQQMRGRTFNFYDANGKTCQSTVKDFFLMKHVIHHFGSIQNWEGGYEEEGKKRTPLPKQEVADAIWGIPDSKDESRSNEGLFLMAKMDACKGSIWARDAAEKAPAIIPVQAANAQWKKLALDQLRMLPSYRAQQKDFKSEDPESKGGWEEQTDSKLNVSMIQSPLLKNPWISVSVQEGAGCGGFSGEIWALWEVSGTPADAKFKLLNKPGESYYMLPLSVIDIEGDGNFEILFNDPNPGFLYMEKGLFQHDYQLITPNYDCPC